MYWVSEHDIDSSVQIENAKDSNMLISSPGTVMEWIDGTKLTDVQTTDNTNATERSESIAENLELVKVAIDSVRLLEALEFFISYQSFIIYFSTLFC